MHSNNRLQHHIQLLMNGWPVHHHRMVLNKNISNTTGANSSSNRAAGNTGQSAMTHKNSNIVPTLQASHSLLSTSKFADANYITIFTATAVTIYKGETTTINASRPPVLAGWWDDISGLWHVPLTAQHNDKHSQMHENPYTMCLNWQTAAKSLHTTMWQQDTPQNQHGWQQSLQQGHCWRKGQSLNTFQSQQKWLKVIYGNNNKEKGQWSPNMTPTTKFNFKRNKTPIHRCMTQKKGHRPNWHLPNLIKSRKQVSHDIMWHSLWCYFSGAHGKLDIWQSE